MKTKYKKTTEEERKVMKEMREKGLTYKAIAKKLGFVQSTIQYHLNEKTKEKTIQRSLKNIKPRDRKKYNKEYMSERYNNDEEFRERVKTHSRECWRRKNA